MVWIPLKYEGNPQCVTPVRQHYRFLPSLLGGPQKIEDVFWKSVMTASLIQLPPGPALNDAKVAWLGEELQSDPQITAVLLPGCSLPGRPRLSFISPRPQKFNNLFSVSVESH